MVNFFRSARTAPAYMPRTGALRQGGASVPEWRHASQTRNERKGRICDPSGLPRLGVRRSSGTEACAKFGTHSSTGAAPPRGSPTRRLRKRRSRTRSELSEMPCTSAGPGCTGGTRYGLCQRFSSVRRGCLQHAGQRSTEPQLQFRLADCTVRAGSVARWRQWPGQVRGAHFEDRTPTACFVRR